MRLQYTLESDCLADKDNAAITKEYVFTDDLREYYDSKFEIGMVFRNVFNGIGKVKRSCTKTRLNNKRVPVKEFSFTAGTPFATSFNVILKF